MGPSLNARTLFAQLCVISPQHLPVVLQVLLQLLARPALLAPLRRQPRGGRLGPRAGRPLPLLEGHLAAGADRTVGIITQM